LCELVPPVPGCALATPVLRQRRVGTSTPRERVASVGFADRIVLEALTNALNHAGPATACVVVSYGADHWRRTAATAEDVAGTLVDVAERNLLAGVGPS
jgi:hypothetical protein